jgi:hypothetical protein
MFRYLYRSYTVTLSVAKCWDDNACLMFVPCIVWLSNNWPTLCTELYYSFIWYAGSYMFRHPCCIFREILMSSWVTWKQKSLCCFSYTVSVVDLCALVVVVPCAQLDNITQCIVLANYYWWDVAGSVGVLVWNITPGSAGGTRKIRGTFVRMLRLPVLILTLDIWNTMWDWQSVEREIYYVDWDVKGEPSRIQLSG